MPTMSVYRYGTKTYDYYDVPGPSPTHAGAPPVRGAGTELGKTPEQAAWTLPPGARKIGSGEMPKGRIASLGGADMDTGSIVKLGAYAVIGYLAWKALIR